jgi:phenylalanyl-tRNA synthetase beta chain
MKVTLNWLRQYVDFDWSPEELAERLTMLGLEVEGVRKIGGEFEGIVVAQILAREKHPNADKLSVCRVQDGRGERLIVCGAQNFQAGDKVPLILPGASLPPKAGEKEPFTIKVGKIRGVESHGMLCSPQELGLPDQVDGLLILRPEAPVGQPFAEYLGRAGHDVIYDLEITPNRPDLNSVIGIAREIAAVTGRPLRRPEPQVAAGALSVAGAPAGTTLDNYVRVRVLEPELCPRYTARVIIGVKVGPSPDWLRTVLEKVGLRSINNVVDVSNYVMLETGQPLHTFDYRLIGRAADGTPTIVVRRAVEGEKFVTLDGLERTLTTDHLLIADEARGIALAGVMGGQNTEIGEATQDVLIESAYFAPTNIRRTSKQLGLRSESSYRFERGADIGIADYASRRCAELILQTAGGQLVPGVADACAGEIRPRSITLRPRKVCDLLGVSLGTDEMTTHLNRLELTTTEGGAESLTFAVPTFRVDLKQEVDLIEEIARLHGVDRIPGTTPRGAVGAHPFDAVYDQVMEARRLLTGMGLNEALGQTLVASAEARRAAQVNAGAGTGAGSGAGTEGVVALANPLSADMDVLRPSLLPGLLDSLRHNAAHKNQDVALFELGRVFNRSGAGPLREERRLAIVLTGQRAPAFWSGSDSREARFDIYDLKGVLEEFLEQFGLRGVGYNRRPDATPWLIESAAIALGGKLALGEMGQVQPALARRYDLRDAVFVAELNFDQLLARRNAQRAFKPLPSFPSVRRDVALVVPESTTHDAVLDVVRKARPANLERVDLFDVFRGRNVPAGQKSVAYAFTYRGADRTLTDQEVNAAHERLIGDFKQKLGATVRDS